MKYLSNGHTICPADKRTLISRLTLNEELTALVNRIQSRSHQIIRDVSSFGIFGSIISRLTVGFLVIGCLGLIGCPSDNSPLHSENLRLKKRLTKQESVIASLQEGNKVMQQQIDLLNQEGRKITKKLEHDLSTAQKKIQDLSKGHQEEDKQLEALRAENLKLSSDAKWLRTQRNQMRKALKVQLAHSKKADLDFPYSLVLKTTLTALSHNGYTVIASMQTDQKAVYVTERKSSQPTSLEFSGFRNQYLLVVEKGKTENSTIWVQADFEKLSQNGKILEAGQQEVSEIELRLIQEIQRTLENPTSS